jgi:serine/threonine protein kinase
MNPGERLSDRYEIIRELGRGGAGITYLARETSTGRDVVAKLLHLGLLDDWKTVELFEREAAVLRGLHHANIPAYVDFFAADLEGTQQFVLVREYAAGTSLQAKVEAGWRATEEEIRDIGARLARIAAYIHSVRPPVIHRDINPRNIIQRDDGELFLLDFGGVQDAIRMSSRGTTTIVGTPGYTPMEQFVGRASVRSDLYAVAATLLFLLTHWNPADLPVKDMKVDFASVIEISSAGLARVLGNWLEPDEGRRTLAIDDAIAFLEGRLPPPRAEDQHGRAQPEGPVVPVPEQPPHGSRITRSVEGEAVGFLVPGSGSGRAMPAFGGFIFFWLVFGGYWGSSAFRTGRPWSVSLMSIPFLVMGISSISWILSSVFGKLGIEIGRGDLTYTRRLFFFARRRSVPLDDVGECRLEEGRERHSWSRGGWGDGGHGMSRYRSREWGRSSGRLSLDVGATTLRFGENLSSRERDWLRDALNEELRKARAAAGGRP